LTRKLRKPNTERNSSTGAIELEDAADKDESSARIGPATTAACLLQLYRSAVQSKAPAPTAECAGFLPIHLNVNAGGTVAIPPCRSSISRRLKPIAEGGIKPSVRKGGF
jgi:hypothetical protein